MSLKSMFTLENKVALVTGASKGLGAEISIALAEAGANIIGVATSSLENTKKSVNELGRQFYSIKVDLSKEESVAELVKITRDKGLDVDILVNNAGITIISEAISHTDEDLNLTFDLNLKAVFRLSREFGKLMIEKGIKGRIINISSIYGYQGGMNSSSYTATKHGVIGITKALANEWGSKGINVNSIAPGYMITDNTNLLREDKERSESIAKTIPKKRWGIPKDIKGPIVFLASDASEYVNGHTLVMDGGMLNV